MQTPPRTELPLIAKSPSGCGCCSTNGSESPASTAQGVEYGVEGLTCGSCADRVERAVRDVDGVGSATVVLVPGGVSRLVVTGPAGPSAVRDAVASAGYSLTNNR
ncbi:heavy-metal-associated domain-containing protein [Paenarthrobacter ureafaciens]|jgi:copper chaperone CopZ